MGGATLGNIGGGTSTFGAFTMATNAGNTPGATNATLNLTGGTTTVNGNISRGNNSGTGTASATVTLNGGMNMFGGEVEITGSDSFGTGAKNLNIQNLAYVNLDGTAGEITLPANMTMSTAGLAFLNTAGNNTINGAISIIAGNATTTATSNGGSLTLTGAIAPGAAVTTTRTLQLSGTSVGANTVSGAISDGVLTNLKLQKSGAGTWALTSAANTYSGNTTVEEGTLSVSTPNFADASTVSIGTSGGPTAILNLPNAGTDTVKTLSIAGVVQPAGKVYGNSASVLPVVATSAITGPGTITVAGTPYTVWADTFLPGNDVSNPAGDNDNDGLLNQQEFAFGLSPISGSSVNPILVQLDKTAGTFTYQRRAATGLTYRILTSTDLVAWTEDATAGQVAGAVDGNGNQTVVVTLTGAPLTAPKLFVRVAAC